ncbi:MAG: hypothetical protein J5534_13040 [Fibrobacter sp.]|nr:hypothetical protein [Fibrobacter sp.]
MSVDWNTAISGWFTTLVSSCIKFLWNGGKSKIKKELTQENSNGSNNAIAAETIENLNIYLSSKTDSSSSTHGDSVNDVVNALVNENEDIIAFNQVVRNNENAVLNAFPFVVQQYLQKKKSYGISQNDLVNVGKLNEKLESMINQISTQFPKKFDECFAKLYINASWECFLDEKFVEKASACYRNNWNDQNDFSSIVKNILPKLQNTGDYNVENDCSRVLQIFWDSLNRDLQYKIAIAYYWIYIDSFRKKEYLQKQFAAKIYEELGAQNVVKEMIKPELKSSFANIEAIAEKYRLKKEWVKEQYDELHHEINLDLDDFART